MDPLGEEWPPWRQWPLPGRTECPLTRKKVTEFTCGGYRLCVIFLRTYARTHFAEHAGEEARELLVVGITGN